MKLFQGLRRWRAHRALVGLLALAAPARAADVADWALPDAELSLVVRGADRLPAKLRELDARFGTTRTLMGVVARLQAWQVAGMHPLAGDFGPGLDPAAGVAVFLSERPVERMRFVVGIKDEVAARASLLALAQAAELPVEATPEGFRVGKSPAPEPAPEPAPDSAPDAAPVAAPDAAPDAAPVATHPKLLKCAKREHFLVCDTDEPPLAAPGRPTQLDADARLDLYLQGGVTAATETPLETFSLRWRDAANGGRVEIRARLRADAALAIAPWIPGDTPVAGLDCIDARSGGVAKISVDGPKLIQALKGLKGRPPPELAPLLAALEKHWSGELVASFAGGMLHPVIAVGLRPGGDGRALLRAVAERLSTPEVAVTATDGGLEVAIPSPDGSGDVTRLRLRAGVTPQSLVLGLTAPDVERCVKGTLVPLKLPDVLAPKGRSGLLISGPVGSVGALPGLIEGPADWRMAEDLLTFSGVATRLIDQIGLAVDVGAQGLAIDLWWEVL